MAHLKRHKVPKNWPIPRKGTTFVVKPANGNIPALVLLRDMLKIVKNKKEMKKAIHERLILLNNKAIIDDKIGATLFDVITLVPSKKHYKLVLSEKGKFALEEIDAKDSLKKVAKIINKKILKGKKIQLNLSDGRNFLTDVKCNMGDSALINFKDKKIEKCLDFKENAKVVVFAGKHAGEKGVINKIDGKQKMIEMKMKDKNVNVLIKQLMVVE